MKIIYPMIVSDFFVPVYEKGSPYVKKFDKKFQQVLEAGLRDSIYLVKKFYEHYKSANQDFKFKPIKNINNQLIVFMIGCTVSVLIFIFELFVC